MSHVGSNGNNHYGGGNNQQRNSNNWRSRNNRGNNRYERFSAAPSRLQGTGATARGQQNPPFRRLQDANASTTLVNSIKQGLLTVNKRDCMTPADSPNNGSPVHRQKGVGLLDSAYWNTDFQWRPQNFDDFPCVVKRIPSLNGSPYNGGPSTSSPSPVGSSRASTYSSSSPPQMISGGSSPMMNYYPNSNNGGRRSSAEEMLCKVGSRSPDNEFNINLQDFASGCASNSQSPHEPSYNFNPIARNVDSRLSDDVNYGYYQTCRSSESPSSEDLSIENIMGEFKINYSPQPRNLDSKRNSGSSGGSNTCNDCPADRACDNCSDAYSTNIFRHVVNAAELVQEPSTLQELSSAISVLDSLPYNHSAQKMPVLNHLLSIPSGNQMIMPNCQINMPKPPSVGNAFPIPGQLGVPAQADDKPLAASSPLMFQNQRVLSEQPILYCSIHNGAQRFYCQTCSKLFCNECGPQHHVGHITVHLLDATENAQELAEQVLTECRFSIATIREEIDKGVIATQTLDMKVREAIASVRNMTRQLNDAVLVREKELLDSIESTRNQKQIALKEREKGLNLGLSLLNQTIDMLTTSVEASSLTSNPLDLFVAKDIASAQIFHVKGIRNNLPPPEEHNIRFHVIDAHIHESIRTLGNVYTGNGHVGDRRLLARPIIPALAPPMPMPRARTISGTNCKVSITNNRMVLNGNPYLGIGKSIVAIGGEFNENENLCRPWGVACDREGYIVIADRSNNRIQIFHSNGMFVRRFGSHGTGRGQFDRPAGITVDAHRRIVVADKDNHRIQVLTMDGEFLLSFGEKGTTPGLFNYPWDVATNDACQIVVSDTRNHRIQLFSAEGVFLRKFGFESHQPLWKCLDSPRGVAFTNDGSIVVTDFNNHRLVVVDADLTGARFLGCDNLSPHPMPPKTFMRPQGVVVDDNGHIIVCDSRNHRVQILDANGVCRWRFGTQGSGPDQMDRPSGVALTPDGKIVVVDFGNNRVLVF